MKLNYNLKCNLAHVLNIVGDKWTLLVLHRIFNGVSIYKDLLEILSPIPTNILSNRLKTLEENELIKSELYTAHPPRYKYILTEKGEDFKDIFYSMIMWANKYLDGCNKTVLHEKCGEEVKIKYYCEKCNEYTEDVIVKEKDDEKN